MNDLISREAVYDMIETCNSDGLKGIFCSYQDGERFKKHIKKIPTVPAIPLSVIEGIKAEIKQMSTNYCGGYIGLDKQEVLAIIDRHIREVNKWI